MIFEQPVFQSQKVDQIKYRNNPACLEYYKESLEKEGEDKKVRDQIEACNAVLNQA